MRNRIPLLFALGLFALPSVPLAHMAPRADDEIVKEFKRYYKKYKDTATRVEAILALEDAESVEVVKVLVPILSERESELVSAAVRVLGGFETRTPVERLLALLESRKEEAVRTGLLRAVAEGGYAGASEALAACLEDSSWEVRRRAVRALRVCGEGAVAELIAPLCEDREPAVRCAVLESLGELRSPLVLAAALADLEHKSWQVRASAIRALGLVRSVDSIAPLIARMELEEGRLREDIGACLGEITGRNFGQRLDAWQRFWETYEGRFEIPTDEELARLRAKQQERKETYDPPGALSFHGVSTPSRSVLFVIDVSGSMEQEVVERERFRDGDYPSFRRIDIVKTELARTVEGFESYVKFNILAFGTDVRRWKKRLVSANVLNKSSAVTWSMRLEALGGASKEDLAVAGLVGAADLESGKTNTFGALSAALGLSDRGARRDEDYELDVDTIFFLSDGRPSWGEYVDADDILREIRAANELRKVVIHTIALGEFEKDFMRQLAEQNGGVFVDLGH